MSKKKKLRKLRAENVRLSEQQQEMGYQAMADWQAKERLGDELRTIEEALRRIREDLGAEF